MAKKFLPLSLRMQLLIVMLSMMLLFVGSLVYLQQATEEKVLELIQNQINGLTKAMEISVEQISAAGQTDKARLQNSIDQLQKRGIEEVSILSKQQEVLLSSNPERVGSRLSVSENEFLIEEKIGDVKGGRTKKLYSSFVPIISKGHLEGYIHISMYFDDLEKLSRDMLFQRVAMMLPVFGLGVILCIFISYRYTKPISALIEAIQSISHGRMPTLPRILQADISSLAESIGDMINKLKEQRAMQEKLKHAEHQAMLAQLASGIAHEIRNPLNFISLSLEHLGALKSSNSAGHQGGVQAELIGKMKAEIQRMNQMVANFLDLGRELVIRPLLLRIDLLVEEVLGLNSQLFKDRGVLIERDYCDSIPVLEMDIDKMKSCFQNLIVNAVDSMPKGGRLRISIRQNNGFVNLSFEDTGEGIRPDHLPKVFEPYFTTKRTGMGLGLAITKRIIEAHKGDIRITSAPGKGTCVKISLPYTGGGQ
jgi:signal transduction histidine kinase